MAEILRLRILEVIAAGDTGRCGTAWASAAIKFPRIRFESDVESRIVSNPKRTPLGIESRSPGEWPSRTNDFGCAET
jgi:hypothetical protein